MKDSGKKKKKKKEGEEEKGGREGRDEFQELYTVGEDSDLDMDFAGYVQSCVNYIIAFWKLSCNLQSIEPKPVCMHE